MVTETETTAATRKRDDPLVPTVRAADQGKPLAEIPALQELFNHRANEGPHLTGALAAESDGIAMDDLGLEKRVLASLLVSSIGVAAVDEAA